MDSRFGGLAERASKLMQKHSIPGMALGMIIDGTDHAIGLGITSTETQLGVDERTLFQIGSTTKTFTATALARLSEEGTLHLDDSVHSHVPELKLADQDVADTITVRHLLNHTTGFAGDLFANTGNGDNSTALYIEHMRELPQLLPPGTIGVYNNAAFVLAGRVIEKVTGETYESALRSLVLDPIGLHESFFEPAAVMLRRFSVGHTIHPDGRVVVASPWELPRSVAAAGGLSSSVLDQLRYARFHMGDGTASDRTRVLSQAGLIEMQTPTIEFIDDRTLGLSWMVSDLGGDKIVAHGGATNGQMSAFWMCQERDLAFVSMTNGSTGRLLNQELTAYAQELFLGYTQHIAEPFPVENPQEFTGTYYSEPNQEVFELWDDGSRLSFQMTDNGRPVEAFDRSADAIPSRVDFLAPDRIIMVGGDLDGSGGAFMRDNSGSITHLRMSRLLIKRS